MNNEIVYNIYNGTMEVKYKEFNTVIFLPENEY